RGGDRWRDTRRGGRLDELEQLDVMIHHIFQSRCAVVVEIRSRLSDAMEAGDVEFVPVVQRWWAAHKARQQRAPGIRAGAPDFDVVHRKLIRANFVRNANRAGLEREARGGYGVDRARTGGVDIVETGDQRRL